MSDAKHGGGKLYTEKYFFDNLRRFSGSDQQQHRITYWCNKIKQCVTRRENSFDDTTFFK